MRYSIGISIAFTAGIAAAHEGTDPLTAWYRSLTTADGKSCCSMHDCAPAEARMKEGRWEVLIFPYNADAPRWFPVPDRAVLRRSPGYRPALAAENGSRSCGCRSRRPAGASGVVRLPLARVRNTVSASGNGMLPTKWTIGLCAGAALIATLSPQPTFARFLAAARPGSPFWPAWAIKTLSAISRSRF